MQRRRGIATNSQAKGPDSDETPESRITGTEEAIPRFLGENLSGTITEAHFFNAPPYFYT